jgi:serpin B
MELERGLHRCLALVIALTLAGAPRAAPAAEGPAREAAESGQALGIDLYRIFSSEDGNFFFSPYSISESLALLGTGAAGKTQAEILRTLHWTGPAEQMAGAFGDQDQQIVHASRDGLTLSVANSLWYQRGQPPRAAFLERAQSDFHVDVRVSDFAADLPVAQHMINYWVEKKTEGRISNLVPPGTLTPRTRMVLANAIYFKGLWASPFKAEETAEKPFYTADGRSVLTATMRQEASFKVAEADGCVLIELPYVGSELAMVIVLPQARDGLPSLELGLMGPTFARWMAAVDAADKVKTELLLPRFKMTYSTELTKALARLGMVTAFVERQADFSAIDGKHDLWVSGALHKAYVEVSEEGTEAAAATGFGMKSLAVVRPRLINVDHPFLFAIRDTASGTVLFLGRIVEPRGS